MSRINELFNLKFLRLETGDSKTLSDTFELLFDEDTFATLNLDEDSFISTTKSKTPTNNETNVDEKTPVNNDESVDNEISWSKNSTVVEEEGAQPQFVQTDETSIDDIWKAAGLEKVSHNYDSVLQIQFSERLTAQQLYENLDSMLESDNEAVKQFAQLFKDSIEGVNLNENESTAFIGRVFKVLTEKNVGTGLVLNVGLNYYSLDQYTLENLDDNGNGTFLDELSDVIKGEASKIKAPQGEAKTINIETIQQLGDDSDSGLLGAMINLENSTGMIYRKIPDMLLSDDAGLREFANMLCDTYKEFGLTTDEQKVRLTAKILEMISKKSPEIKSNGSQTLTQEMINSLDENKDGSMFDELNDILKSDELKIRYESMVDDFYDLDSMFEWLSVRSNDGTDKAQTGLSYEELFELAKDESWNARNNNFFASVWRNIDEIDTDSDGVISYEEMKAVIGSGIQDKYYKNGFLCNIADMDCARSQEYAKLSNEEKLEKVIEEAKRYCEMKGLDKQLNILNGHGGHWKVKVGGASEGAAGTCKKASHTIHLDDECLDKYSFEYMVGVLLHESTHAVYSEYLNSIEQENYCDQIKEDYLDTVGLGQYAEDEEAEKIDYENSTSPIYKNLPHDNSFLRNVVGGVAKVATDVWNWIKGWF